MTRETAEKTLSPKLPPQNIMAEQEAAESESVPVEEAVAEVEDESPAEAVDEQEL